MRNDMASYFEDPEFKESLARYEGIAKDRTPAYFDADELTDIAEYYVSKGRRDDADKAIDFALRLHPDSTDALIFRARSLASDGELEKAREVAKLIDDTTDREVKFLEADLLMEEDRIEEADELFKQLARDEGNELETLIDIIYDYIDVNRADYAKKWLHHVSASYDIAQLSEKHSHFRDMLCDFYLTFNQPEKAIPLLHITLDKQPYSIRHWTELGRCHLLLGNFEEAHDTLDFALAIDDKNEDVLILKAMTYKQSGNPQETIRIYRELIEKNGYQSRIEMALVKTYFEMRDFRQALKYMSDFIRRSQATNEEEQAEWYSELALCYAGTGRFREGYDCIQKVKELDVCNTETMINMGHFYLLEGRERAATDVFECALEDAFEPEEMYELLLMIGTVCFETRHFELAVHYFERINSEFPKEAKTTYFFLLYCYYHLQQIGPLMWYFIKIKNEMPEMYEQLGDANEKTLTDDNFNEMLQALKAGIRDGKIDLRNYS